VTCNRWKCFPLSVKLPRPHQTLPIGCQRERLALSKRTRHRVAQYRETLSFAFLQLWWMMRLYRAMHTQAQCIGKAQTHRVMLALHQPKATNAALVVRAGPSLCRISLIRCTEWEGWKHAANTIHLQATLWRDSGLWLDSYGLQHLVVMASNETHWQIDRGR
jgi:hypothetical protein